MRLHVSICGRRPVWQHGAACAYYPVPLVLSRFLEPELRIVNQGEIGFSFGSATQFRLLGLSIPRIGTGFIFGGGLTVLRYQFGFQF